MIDAEMARRKLLEDTPIDSLREDPVNFDTSEVPWWAWVRRFHLPEVSPSFSWPSTPTLLAGCLVAPTRPLSPVRRRRS